MQQIAVVDRALVHFVGLMSDDDLLEGTRKSLERAVRFVQRELAESNYQLKQIVPYGVIRCSDSVLLLRRNSTSNNAEIANKFSIGVGGHAEPRDAAGMGQSIFMNCLKREIREEILLQGEAKFRLIGFINDEESYLGALHLAVIYLVDVTEPAAKIRTTTEGNEFKSSKGKSMSGTFVPVKDLAKFVYSMDRWSAILSASYFRTAPMIEQKLLRFPHQ